jgi:hypothetical protein
MNPLESRKQLLIAESELNRAQLSEEWQTMTHGLRDLAHQSKTIGAWASAGALLVAALAAFRHRKAMPAEEKPSWFQTVLKGAQLANSIWLAFRPRPR